MAITMNISGYEIERTEAVDKYEDEAARAEWIARLQVGVVPHTVEESHASFPPELVHVDVDAFLEKMRESRN